MTLDPRTLPRLLALARATEEEADRLLATPVSRARDDLANVRFGQAMGLRQAVEMLAAEYPDSIPASSV